MAVTESSGNGYALYNGVKTPNIESVWDKTKYSYASICVMNLEPMGLSGNVYALYLVAETPVFDGSDLRASGNVPWATYFATDTADASELIPGISTSSWVLDGEGDYAGNPVYDKAIWVSNDTLNEDGSTYLAASDPVPLDGMNVIEWDGDTTGLTDLTEMGMYGMYLVNDTFVDFGSDDPYVISFTNGAEYAVYTPELTDLDYNTASEGGEWYWTLGIGSLLTLVGGFNVPSVGVVGTVFQGNVAYGRIALFAYPSGDNPGGGDEPDEPDTPDEPEPPVEPDEPVKDKRTDFFTGFASGLSGVPAMIADMDNSYWLQGYIAGEAFRKML